MNTFRPSVNTLGASGEQVFTQAPVCAPGGMPLASPPDRPPSPRAALPCRSQQVYTRSPTIPPSYPSCPAPPPHPPSRLPRLPLLTSPGMPPAASPRALDPAMNRRRSLRRRAPRARQRLAARAAGGRPEPESPARPKIRSKLSLASPIPYGDRAGERQFPPSPPPIRRPRPGSSGDRPAGSNRQGQPPKRRGV